MSQNILLVDDEAGIIHAIRRMLRSESFNIFEANSGDEALAILERHDIHLMISDYKMPGMNGLTLCHKSRAISPTTYRLLLSGRLITLSCARLHRMVTFTALLPSHGTTCC